MGKSAKARATAARILCKLLAGQGSLSSHLAFQSDSTDAPLVQEICYGVCRYFYVLEAAVNEFLDKPLRNKDQDIYCLLLVGTYQIFRMRIPNHAAVNETVQATRLLKKPWARGLVNSVLRRQVEQKHRWQAWLEWSKSLERLEDPGNQDGLTKLDSLEGAESRKQAEIRYLHPFWLIQAIKHDWPGHWQQILANNNRRAPMCLRINQRKTIRDAYLHQLQNSGRNALPGKLADTSIYLDNPCPVEDLPGFFNGLVSVQDEASQLVAPLMELAPGQAVLDACAAPGGKTCHILESEPSLTYVQSLDIEEGRLQGIKQNLQRLGLQAEVRTADASQIDQWWDGTPFHRILLDAPCSATGVIRRHPDIKILRTPRDIELLTRRQQILLQNLWRCLAPGGLLLYTTCSVLKAENEQTIDRFLASCGDAKYQAIAADWGLECAFGRQLFPVDKGNDGFYYALLQKC